MKTHLNKSKVYILILIAAFSAGRFTGPKTIETKEVEKIVFRDKVIKDQNKKVRLETRETTLPDGTKVKETIRSRDTDTHINTSREVDSSKESESKTSNQSTWSVGVYTNKEFLAGTVDKRIIGGVFLGVYGRTQLPVSKPEFGVGLRLEF